MGRREIRIALAAAALLCVAAPGALARTDLSTNGRGDQVLLHHVLLQQNRPLFAGTRDAGGSIGMPAPLTGRFSPSFADSTVDDSGGAVAVFTGAASRNVRTVAVAVRPSGGAFGAPRVLDRVFETVPVLAMAGNGRGDVVVAWSTYDHGAKYSVRSAGGSFSPPAAIPGGRSITPVGLAADGDGGGILVSTRDDAATKYHRTFVASKLSPGGKFGKPHPIQGVPREASVSFAAARSGRALLGWTDGRERMIRAVEREPGGSFGPRFDVIHAGTNGIRDLALAPSGAAALVLGDDTHVQVAVRPPGGVFGAPVPVGEMDEFEEPRVSVDERGDAAAVWGLPDNGAAGAYLSASGGGWQPFDIAPPRPGSPGGPVVPSVAIDDDGRATTAWEESDGATVRTFVRDFSAAGAAAATEVHAVPTFRREHPASACRPRHARVVRSRPQSTVVVSGLSMYGCLLARGTRVELTVENLFPPRTLSLAGPLVAYADDYVDDEVPYESTTLRVTDLRDEAFGIDRSAELESTDVGELAATRLRANGAVAWISCPRRHSAFGHLTRSCERRGGRPKHVWAWDSTAAQPRRVDSGKQIVPRSLALHGSKLTWRNGARQREAELR